MRISRLALKVYGYGVMTLVATIGVIIATVFVLRAAQTSHEKLSLAQHLASDLWYRRENPSVVRQEVAEAGGLENSQVTLYDLEGHVLASLAEPPLPPPTAHELREVRDGRVIQGQHGVSVHPIEDDGRVVAIGVVDLGPPPLERLIAPFSVVLVLLMGLAIAFARHIVKPLQRVARAAERFGRGDLAARSEVARTDELGDVARSFDAMADRITELMTAQQELMANVSHELMTPLARIHVAVDLIAEGEAEQAKELVPEIAHDLTEIERLIDDIMTVANLALSRAQRGSMTPLKVDDVCIRGLIEKAVQRFEAQHRSYRLAIEIAEELPVVRGDSVLLRRVVENLLDNARKYSSAEDTIRLRAERSEEGVLIAVSDSGIGMEQADLGRAFTPFFRGDKSRARATGGVGLGLALAKRVIEAHGGTIEIQSALGSGTTVTLRVPVPSGAPDTGVSNRAR